MDRVPPLSGKLPEVRTMNPEITEFPLTDPTESDFQSSESKPEELETDTAQPIESEAEAESQVDDNTESDDEILEHQPTGPAGQRKNPERSLELAMAAVKVCYDNFARDVLLLDMTEKTALFDYFVVATGTSRRHLHAISEEIDDVLEKQLQDRRMSREGYDESRWIVLDYGSLVIHLFDDETRQYYSLEVLHSDAPKIDTTHLQPKGYKSGTDE